MKRFKHILFVWENTVNQNEAIARTASLVQSNQARLTIIDVMPSLRSNLTTLMEFYSGEDLMHDLAHAHRENIRQEATPLLPDIHFDIVISNGTRFLEVTKQVLKSHYDLVIKAAENPARTRKLFSSDDMHLLRKCPCPDWLNKPGDKSNYKNIVASVDFPTNGESDDEQEEADQFNLKILTLASSLAIADYADLHIVHAWDIPELSLIKRWADDPEDYETKIIESKRSRSQHQMQKLLRKFASKRGKESHEYLKPQTHLPMGTPSIVIPELVEKVDADLVVMGTIGRTGIPGFIIGNTAEAMLDQMRCSVLAIKPDDFDCPISLNMKTTSA